MSKKKSYLIGFIILLFILCSIVVYFDVYNTQSKSKSSSLKKTSTKIVHYQNSINKKNPDSWCLKSIGYSKSYTSKENPKEAVRIAILDSGINKNHPSLKGLVVKEFNAISPKKPIIDLFGHGTAIAGIISTKSSVLNNDNFSSNIKIYSAKVLNDKGKGDIDSLIKGLEWAISNKVNLINISFGLSENRPELEHIINKAVEKGIIIVAAAGNKYGLNADYPARYKNVLSINALNQNYKVESSTSASGKIDYALPGVSCISINKNEGYKTYSGTSIATAHMSNIIVKIISEKNKYNITKEGKETEEAVKKLLLKNAIPLGNKRIYGNGFVKIK